MKLVGISGSSIGDWMVIDGQDTVMETTTMGFNPFFHNEVWVKYTIERCEEIMQYQDAITEINFYGAGCTSEERIGVIYRAFKILFPKVDIKIDNYLVGSVYATADGQPCIVNVLGTGSDSCYFDGENIIETVPSLGHFLGDEGGGAYFGRKILTQYLYGKLPKHLHQALTESHGLDKEVIFKNVYNMPNSNVYLASIMKTISNYKDDPFVTDFVYKGLSRFITYHIWACKKYKQVPSHFVGSVAFFFEDLLKEVCYKHRVQVGKVIKKPIYSLTEYHKNQ